MEWFYSDDFKLEEATKKYKDATILAKDIGFNPLYFKVPIIPLLQYLYTPIDKSILKEYIIYFGITEINTDTGLFFNSIKKETYLKYKKILKKNRNINKTNIPHFNINNYNQRENSI